MYTSEQNRALKEASDKIITGMTIKGLDSTGKAYTTAGVSSGYTSEEIEILNEVFAMDNYMAQMHKEYDAYADEAKYYGKVMCFDEFCYQSWR